MLFKVFFGGPQGIALTPKRKNPSHFGLLDCQEPLLQPRRVRRARYKYFPDAAEERALCAPHDTASQLAVAYERSRVERGPRA